MGNLLRSLTVPCGSILVVWLGQSGFVPSCCWLGIAERVRLLEAGGAILVPRELCG